MKKEKILKLTEEELHYLARLFWDAVNEFGPEGDLVNRIRKKIEIALGKDIESVYEEE